jgi:pyruvate dehydrogenase E2 component (dihydrolipoamide acetyltransferase)
MPQMGESVAEGTIVRWLKKVGDAVERDEPLFEISTDKVDAEIPSPSAGVVSEIRVKEGETVPVNSVVAVIGEGSGAAATPPAAPPKPAAAPAPQAPPPVATVAPVTSPSALESRPTAHPPVPSVAVGGASPRQASAPPAPVAPVASRAPVAPRAPNAPLAPNAPSAPLSRPWSAAEARELRLSPLVRKIAKEHHVDVRNISGSGSGGRVTKTDILGYLDAGAPVSVAPLAAGAAGAAGAAHAPNAPVAPPAPRKPDPPGVERVPMTVMRRRISEHMVMSRRTSAHVHSVFEVDFTKADEIRKSKKADYEKAGSKITYMSFITKAVADALKAVPVVNSSIDGNDVLYKKDINIGVAVALDWGLIVPVIKNADKKNLLEISKAIVDVAARARDKKLSPDDVQGGTFTITNPGVFGALFGMPIINQPQVAILGIGAVEKRPVVVNDAVTVRMRAYMTIGYDHRIIDGAVADEFMSHVKKTIENFDPALA